MNIFRLFSSRSVLLLFLTWPASLFGQDEKELAPVSRTYAITNATIIQGPGRKIERGTVVIKDGLFLSVGKDVPVPADAIIIKSDSLFVYPGFIDGLSHAGVSKPKDDASHERAKDPGNPTPERAGITPQVDVRNFLNPAEKSSEEIRSMGFTAAQVVPWGVFLPGTGAVVLLGGGTANKMVITSPSSFYAELSTNQGVFPSTVIGVISKWHELYKQASDAMTYEGVYAANRTGLERPANDKVLQAFYPVIEKKTAVLFKAEKMLDIYRVLELQSDLHFNLVLGNIKEGWTLAEKIKQSGAKVFLSLDLPDDKTEDDKKEKKSDDKKTDTTKAVSIKKELAKEKSASDKEKETLEKRRTEFIAKYASVASLYQKSGIVFGFSTLGVKANDIPANIRKIIAAGLTEDQALAALTTSPAQLLGVSDRLGSIDKGKIANLVITDKPCFNEKANVRYVFVDGELFRHEIKDAKKEAGSKKTSAEKKEGIKSDVSGTWTFTSETPDGKHENKIILKKEGSSYTGTASGDRMVLPAALKEIEISDDHIKFAYTLSVEGASIEVTVEGKYEGGTFSGTSKTTAFGSFVTNGVKDPGL